MVKDVFGLALITACKDLHCKSLEKKNTPNPTKQPKKPVSGPDIGFFPIMSPISNLEISQ